MKYETVEACRSRGRKKNVDSRYNKIRRGCRLESTREFRKAPRKKVETESDALRNYFLFFLLFVFELETFQEVE